MIRKMTGECGQIGRKRSRVRRLNIAVMAAALLCLGLAGCAQGKKADMQLKVGLMPAVDAAPILYADEQGYFEKQGLKLELEMFTNAQDRQSALQAQSIDGAITDLIAVATNVNSGFPIKATSMTDGGFPVLAREALSDGEALKVGMMEVSVTNFLADQWLSDGHSLDKVFINDIPARLAAIGGGQLDAGIFPEPLASMGELKGMKKLNFAQPGELCPDVLVFTDKALKGKESAIKAFYAAYNQAVDALNQDEEAARSILMAKIPNLSPDIKDKILLPEFTRASLPDEGYLERIISWTGALVPKLEVKPADLVDSRFVR